MGISRRRFGLCDRMLGQPDTPALTGTPTQ